MVKLSFLFLTFLSWPLLTRAQAEPVLTMGDCIERIQAHSYILQADAYRTAASEQQYNFRTSRTLPQFSGELAREDRFLQPYYFNQQWALVHMDWSLGDYILKTGQAARQDIETSKFEEEQSRLDAAGRIASLYISILQDENKSELLKKQGELLQAHLEIARSLYISGIRTQFDVLQTKSGIEKLREQISTLEIDRESLRSEMARLMGWSVTDSLRLAHLETAEICEQPVPVPDTALVNTNPVILALSSRIRAQHMRTNAADAQKYPHLFTAGGYFADKDPTSDGNYWQLNAGLAFPLYQWGSVKYQKQESRAMVSSLEYQVMDVQREILIHTNQLAEKMTRLKKLLSLQADRLETTRQAVQFAEAHYEAGTISNLEYLSVRQQAVEAGITIEETRLEFAMNLIEYYVSTNQPGQIAALGTLTGASKMTGGKDTYDGVGLKDGSVTNDAAGTTGASGKTGSAE